MRRASQSSYQTDASPFWRIRTLDEMTVGEWESLCDRCGLCCRLKDLDDETGEITYTSVACRLLNIETCACSDYGNRHEHVPDCIRLEPATIAGIRWLPSSCAYRLLAAGEDLPEWHPLVTGDPESAHRAGFNVCDRVVSETDLS